MSRGFSKYSLIFLLTLQEYLTYRFNFLMWRFRSLVAFVALVVFWQVIYAGQASLFGYRKEQMMAYVVGVALLRGLVLATRSADLAGQIRSGELSLLMLKPWRIFLYYLSRDVADKLLNFVFVLLEIWLISRWLVIAIYLPHQPVTVLLFTLSLVFGIVLFFLLSLIISLAAFWTEDIWATRFLVGVVLLEFMAGSYFPIDFLPKALAKIIYLTPFPYLIYYPVKIWNEQLTTGEVGRVMMIELFWLGLIYLLAVRLWQRGRQLFGAYGG